MPSLKKQQRDKDRADRQAVYASEWWLTSELYRQLRYGHGHVKVPPPPDRDPGEPYWQQWEQP
jgi:hypothetical protein